MIMAADSSVLIACLVAGDANHHAAADLLRKNRPFVYRHALSEVFSTLTGGKLRFRLSAAQAAELIRDELLPRIKTVELDEAEMVDAMAMAQERGVRGGAIYDFLHLTAARKVKASRFHTTDVNDFRSFHRPGDPEVSHP